MSLGSKLIRSSGILVGIKFLQRSLGVVSTLILARLLTPESFGIVAVAALVIYFSEVISNTGIQQYLVQVEGIDDDVVNTAWTLNLIIKVAICAVLYLSLPLIGIFYEDPNVIYAISVLIPVIAIRALMNPELHLQRRDLNYREIFKVEVFSKFLSFICVITIAFVFETFWAIIAGDIVSSFVMLLLSYRYSKHRPRLRLNNVKNQWIFSKWMMARGCFGYLRAQVDTLLISQFFSLANLGRFNVAREFTIMPANEIIRPAVEPLLATFSSARSNSTELERQVSLSLLVISIFLAPIVTFLFFCNSEFVAVVLGSKWAEAAPLMQAMTPLLMAFSLSGLLNSIFIAFGKIKQIFYFDAFVLVAIIFVLFLVKDFKLFDFIWIRSLLALAFNMVLLFIATRLYKASFLISFMYFVIPYILCLLLGYFLTLVGEPKGFWQLGIFVFVLFLLWFLVVYSVLAILSGFNSISMQAKKYIDLAFVKVYRRFFSDGTNIKE